MSVASPSWMGSDAGMTVQAAASEALPWTQHLASNTLHAAPCKQPPSFTDPFTDLCTQTLISGPT